MNTALRSIVGQDDDEENPMTVAERVEYNKRSIVYFEKLLEEALTSAALPDAEEDAQQNVDELRELITLFEAGLEELQQAPNTRAE